ncbi:glycerophosphodiester phosphodiesterase [Oceanobacillus sp. CAU 1775]
MKIRGIAERGYAAQFPENTLSSFRAATEQNFTHIKLEVHLTKDQIPVVIHDFTLDKTTNGTGEVADYTYKELQRFSINHDERIPTLEEVLLFTKGKVITGIEIKQLGFYQGLEEKVFQIIEKLDCHDDVFILSRNHHSLARIRMLSKNLKLGLISNEITASDIHLLKELNATHYMVKFNFHMMDNPEMQQLEKMNIQIITFTINTIEKMNFLRMYPNILIATKELEKFKAILYPATITNWQKVGI